ncbi:VanZ family protein [Ornithinibacillus sp. FSL M8-0202]|uniref:VanZ family protein n=1 Tax=Ornithinibacillus sp. FSL M8-0202 TaxID=2921616 RepID=UPI0030D6125F
MDILILSPILLITFVILYGLVSTIYLLRKKTSIIQLLINLSFYIYLFLLINKSLFPIPISEEYIQMLIEQETESQNKFIPLDIKNMIDSYTLSGIFDNLLLLTPFGFYAPLVFKRINNLKSTLLLVFITSISIETSKLLISSLISFTYKGFVIDNIILNTIGGLIGFLILALLIPILKKLFNKNKMYFDHNKFFIKENINEN